MSHPDRAFHLVAGKILETEEIVATISIPLYIGASSSGNAGLDAVHQAIAGAAITITATPRQYQGQAAALWGLGFLIAWLSGDLNSELNFAVERLNEL